MPGRILFCGDRNWTDMASVAAVMTELIRRYGDDISIIQGAARGADTIAGDFARNLELVCVSVPAKWDKYGKPAGVRRNEFMLKQCKPQLVVAFHADLENSKGTGHMVKISKAAGVPVLHIKDKETVEMIHDKYPESLCSKITN